MNKYIELFEKTKLLKQQEAAETIFKILIKNKTKKFKWSKAFNEIHRIFTDRRNENIINKPKYSNLKKAYEKGLSDFDFENKLLAIPNHLYEEFKKTKGLDITFEKYIIELATENGEYIIDTMFSNGKNIYQMMYDLNKFEGYENFQKFDANHIKPYNELEELFNEVHRLRYPSLYINENKTVTKKKQKPAFIFYEKYRSIISSFDFYQHCMYRYFSDITEGYEKFYDVFLNKPGEHDSHLVLECKTQTFAVLLKQLVTHGIAKNISLTEIEKQELFKTTNGKPLTRANISNSRVNIPESELIYTQETIDLIKKLKQKEESKSARNLK